MSDSQRSGGSNWFTDNNGGFTTTGRKQGKWERTRRSWSDAEEIFLLGCLKELVALGWKSDNGFRGGYQQKLEDSLRREFPRTDLKANPHIGSKIHTWKKIYGALSLVLGRSGVGFNLNGDYKIDCNEEQWDQIIKADSGARFLRNKAWPYYDDWKIVFGKDRANGDAAKDTDAAVGQMNVQPLPASTNGVGNEYRISFDDSFGQTKENDHVSPDTTDESAFSSAKESGPPARTNKKRKGGDDFEGLVQVIAKMHDSTNERLKDLANRIGYEFDLTKARKEVFELVGGIPGLTLGQIFDASDFILEKVERLDFFMSLPQVAKQAYVYRALEKAIIN
ncbi:hypothetical protein AAHA92_17017 [Salvia divinorum]|uniref:Myb/SANT-like domain-containing protein n=1 Tax=Salvia divinorum TaxID=28513 RepID=A0ABD1GXE6_SALDI